VSTTAIDPSDRLRQAWPYTWRDLWRPFLRHPPSPHDLINELLRKVVEETRPTRRGENIRNGIYLTDVALNRMDVDLDLSSSAVARFAFKNLRSGDFKSSRALARFFEAGAAVVDDFDDLRLSARYIALLRRFISRYNLPYSMRETPLVLRLRLSCTAERIYAALERAAESDDHLAEALDAFGRAWGEFSDADPPNDLKATIEKASKLAEAFAAKQVGAPGTLGDLTDRLKHARAFPHATLGEAVKRLYGFCSNYPHIRHAGNPAGVLRALESRDVVFVSLVLVAFAAYANGWPD